MNTNEIVALLDSEIARLQQVKAILASSAVGVIKRKPGRPSGAATAPTVQPTAIRAKRRVLSAAAREKIAAAQKKRWAKVRREAKQTMEPATQTQNKANTKPAPRVSRKSHTAKKQVPAKKSAETVKH